MFFSLPLVWFSNQLLLADVLGKEKWTYENLPSHKSTQFTVSLCSTGLSWPYTSILFFCLNIFHFKNVCLIFKTLVGSNLYLFLTTVMKTFKEAGWKTFLEETNFQLWIWLLSFRERPFTPKSNVESNCFSKSLNVLMKMFGCLFEKCSVYGQLNRSLVSGLALNMDRD